MKPVRVALIGAGFVADAHIKGYWGHKDAQVVAVCDTRAEFAKARAREFGAQRAYARLDDVLADEEINAVDIMTPSDLHAPMAVQAANAGRHVLCEKPCCVSLSEGKAMAEAARRNRVAMAIGESYVFTTPHRKARELIADGAIGAPMLIRQRFGDWAPRRRPSRPQAPEPEPKERWRDDPRRSGGGKFPWLFDHAVHFFATARLFALDAPIESVLACSAAYGAAPPHAPAGQHEDVPLLLWTFEGGAAHGVFTRAERLTHGFDPMPGFHTAVHGAEGMIEVLGESAGGLYWDGKPCHLLLHRRGKPPEPMRFDEEGPDRVWNSEVSYYDGAHIQQVRDFIEAIVAGRPPRYGPEQGAMDVRCVLATILSIRQGQPIRLADVPDDFTAFGD